VLLGIVISGPVAAASAARTSDPSWILTEAQTGQVLLEHAADAPWPAHPLSPLMILLLSVEQARLGALPLEAPVTISATATGLGRYTNRIVLNSDQTYVLSDLLKAIAVSAADNAAVAAGEAIAGSLPDCIEMMNARAQRLGMLATQYGACAGLQPPAHPPGSAHAPDTTTARDLARLSQALVTYPVVLRWSSLTGLPFDQGAVALRNANQLIGGVPGVDGLAVSTTRSALGRIQGYNIVATAQRSALRLIAVVLGAPDSAARYTKAVELLESGFARYQRLNVVQRGDRLNAPVRVVGGQISQLTPVAGSTVSLFRQRDEDRDLRVHYQVPAELHAPIAANEALGELIVEEEGQLIAVVPVLSPVSVAPIGALSAALH